MNLLDHSIRRRKDNLRNTVKALAWPITTKNKAKALLDELERHKSTFDLAFSADIWYSPPFDLFNLCRQQLHAETEEASVERKVTRTERQISQYERQGTLFI